MCWGGVCVRAEWLCFLSTSTSSNVHPALSDLLWFMLGQPPPLQPGLNTTLADIKKYNVLPLVQ